ncbi:MAG TPA: preprotein translocase subunit YajC [Candidatus Scatomonas pullistercoris]|uniref:Preprotein translocase subunit YajC n=1 Tax=Candidatus Scatomonas pullistercoris TaxID=2840920 RepID=A0A9D1TA10_9FIRM|nr:preprotein translocase subunit YajC [Candidatus Scatomonas pullistercoris]
MIFASETSTASSSGGMGMMLIGIVVLVALMYFMMIRPQKKEQKRMQSMLSDLAVGDAIVTNSGFYGTVINITEDDVIVEFGNNRNCRIPMRKSAIAAVEKPEEAAAAAEKETKKDSKTEKVETKKK